MRKIDIKYSTGKVALRATVSRFVIRKNPDYEHSDKYLINGDLINQ
jgi:hypothetical protein